MSTIEIAARVLGGPIAGLIIDGIKSSNESMNKASANSLRELEEEAKKQDIQMEFQKHQARIAQELAIAKRIENAIEVEIEEYYDVSASGRLGLDATAESVGVGASGTGKKVTKRVYRFKGNNTVIEQEL